MIPKPQCFGETYSSYLRIRATFLSGDRWHIKAAKIKKSIRRVIAGKKSTRTGWEMFWGLRNFVWIAYLAEDIKHVIVDLSHLKTGKARCMSTQSFQTH